MDNSNNKQLLSFMIFILFAFWIFINRYEYTKFLNGRIYQRVNKITGEVETLCKNNQKESYWHKGGGCFNTYSNEEVFDSE